MIELPEALTLAKELNESVIGKKVEKVHPPTSPHKFCWFNGDSAKYGELLELHTVEKAEGFGIFVELTFHQNIKLNFNDGVNVRMLRPKETRPKKYQLMLDFTDESSIVFTVAMYGSIICHSGDYDNKYYIKSRQSISPFTEAFNETYFNCLLDAVKPAVSVKAFLATEQRIPGLGNGSLQDILFHAKIHPKRKVETLTPPEKNHLLHCIKTVLGEMTLCGGRDTEKDLFGSYGSYKTLLSKNTYTAKCPLCGGQISRETYLGGAIYYCLHCQPLQKGSRLTDL